MQAQTSKWVTAAVWGTLALLASFVVPRILERELEMASEQGYAVDHQEFMVGVRSIAVAPG